MRTCRPSSNSEVIRQIVSSQFRPSIIVTKFDTRLICQTCVRSPAHANQQQIAFELVAPRCEVAITLKWSDCSTMHRRTSMSRRHSVPPEDRKRRSERFHSGAAACSTFTLIYQRNHFHSGSVQIRRYFPAIIVSGDNYCAASWPHRMQMQQSLSRAAKHHARQIIIIKQQRPLKHTGCQYHRPSSDFVQSVAARGCYPVVVIPSGHCSLSVNTYVCLCAHSCTQLIHRIFSIQPDAQMAAELLVLIQ